MSFIGRLLDAPPLTDWFGEGVSIQPNACVLLAFSRAAVVLVQSRLWRAVFTLGVFVGIASALILLQCLVGADFGFNHQLLFGRTWGQKWGPNTTLPPGRVGPPASFSFTCTGMALVLLAWTGLEPRHAHWRRVVPVLGVDVCAIIGFSIPGYLFGAEQFTISLRSSIRPRMMRGMSRRSPTRRTRCLTCSCIS